MVSSWFSDHKSIKRSTVCAMLSVSLLSGCVSMQAIKSPNETFGVPATDRTLAQRILDKSIENTAIVNISRISPIFAEHSQVSVNSFYSTVLLTGEVPDEASKKQVEAIVASMPDVKKLYNKLQVANIRGASYTIHDAYLSSKINAKILANNAIKNSQVKVVTDDGITYVMGKLTPAQREHLINIINSTIGIKELVLLTDLIDNTGAIINEDAVIQEKNLEPPAPRYIEEPVQGVPSVDQSYINQQATRQAATVNYPNSPSDNNPPNNLTNNLDNNLSNSADSQSAPVRDTSNIYPSPYVE
ncbi:BON domain-containing protein [Psychrobacter sp.]|uniref:BON domain-containing protein n=1 Tax=Psychrobacter sp. TaxID=56811 RepID=UPI0025F551AD|nr:BON domain-containing protein [Psychrobacter sp.]